MVTCLTHSFGRSNLSERLNELARSQRYHAEQLHETAEALDYHSQCYALDRDDPQRIASMLTALLRAKALYVGITGKALTSD